MASSPDAPSSSEPLSYSWSMWTMEIKIAEYELVRAMDASWSVRSGIFNVGGCDWSLICYPNGNSEDSAHIFLVVFGLENDAVNGVKDGEPSLILAVRFVQEILQQPCIHPYGGPESLGRIAHLEATQYIC
ncbi:hypothetical protein ACMD2_09829 [Ananas comosus]|uniref:MATH domain-containing protein n=1 Tax=Ananas comosus TaxID=4615 RepID=A0A199VKD4_ANACO|nr:hypothetical protein ACMD2_09829 [Ananas comosus]